MLPDSPLCCLLMHTLVFWPLQRRFFSKLFSSLLCAYCSEKITPRTDSNKTLVSRGQNLPGGRAVITQTVHLLTATVFIHSFYISSVQGAKLFTAVPIITIATYQLVSHPNYLWVGSGHGHYTMQLWAWAHQIFVNWCYCNIHFQFYWHYGNHKTMIRDVSWLTEKLVIEV